MQRGERERETRGSVYYVYFYYFSTLTWEKPFSKITTPAGKKMFDSALARTFTTVGKILERHFAAQQTVNSSNFSVRVKEFVRMQHGG